MENKKKKDWKNYPWTTYKYNFDWIHVVAFFVMLIAIIFFS